MYVNARKRTKVESHYRDKGDQSNRAWFEKPISKLQPRLKRLCQRFKYGTQERERGGREGGRERKGFGSVKGWKSG